MVPTWNYVAVHAAGPLEFIRDEARLRAHLERLTTIFEAGLETPWALSDAPDAYVERMLKKVVGFEMRIGLLTGKWKLSQNRPAADQAGVVEGLAGEPSAAAQEVGRQVAEALTSRLAGET